MNRSPFTDEVEQATHLRRFTTSSITPFEGDSNPNSDLRHLKSAIVLHKADDALICKVFTMALHGVAQLAALESLPLFLPRSILLPDG